jgi:hypothetical protein
LTSPRESGIINAKIANGQVKPDSRFPAKLKKPPVFVAQPEAEVPVHNKEEKSEDKKGQKKEPNANPKKEPKSAKKKKEPLTFPATIKINHYGFVNLRKQLLEALGWTKDMTLSVVKNLDASVTLRKA